MNEENTLTQVTETPEAADAVAEVPAGDEQVAETPAAVDTVTEPEERTDEQAEETVEDDEPAWFKKRAARWTRKVYEERQAREQTEAENKRLRAELEAAKNPAPKMPNLQDYDDVNAYNADLQAYIDRVAKGAAPSQPAAAAPADPAFVAEVQRVNEAGRAQFADYDTVIAQAPISQEVAKLLFDSDRGHEVAYYLGQNVTEAMGIATMTPTQAARELGRIEATLDAATRKSPKPKPKSTTAAPPPPTTQSGGEGVPSVDPSKLSTEQWAEMRRAGKI